MPTSTKTTEASRAELLAAGTKKHFASTASLTFGSGTYTPAQVETSLSALVGLHQGVADARAALKSKIADEVTQGAPLRSQMAAFAAFVKTSFAGSPDVLADFGLKAKKARTPLTIPQKAASAAKAKATRAARHTMGTKQKMAVKGTVTTIVTSADAAAAKPASTSPPTSPAPQATTPAPSTHGA
jgi:hypothetical protein